MAIEVLLFLFLSSKINKEKRENPKGGKAMQKLSME